IFGAKDQGINLLQIKKDAKAFVSDKDGKEEFPNIRFTFNGKSM
ncbi:TPA: DNA integration/recombination/inversion protein, partial [Streptococcus agalactiae]